VVISCELGEMLEITCACATADLLVVKMSDVPRFKIVVWPRRPVMQRILLSE
jgi:hypothetical protein